MKNMNVILAVLLILALALTGCGNNGNGGSSNANTDESTGSSDEVATNNGDGEKGKIGVLLPSLAMDFQAQMAAGVKRAADEFGYGYQEVDYNFDAELQISGAETLAASGVGAYYGIFMNAESANESFAQNPEIGTISQSADVNAKAFMANDYIDMGQQFVDAVDYFRTENGIEGGQVAAIWMTANEVVGSDFYDAMMDVKSVIEPYCAEAGLDYVSDQFAEIDEDAANVAEQLLNAYPDLRYIFCFNNGFAIVTSNEISSARSDTSEYFVFSSEGDEESFRQIAANDAPYRGCAYQDIEANGYKAGLQLINWIENGEIEDVVVVRELVDIRNVADYIG